MLAGLRLARPIHLAFSYDEEVGCRGVPHLIAHLPELCAKPLGVIVGEPSGMRAVRGHKGKAAARVTINGRSGHSSRPDLGLNAIHAMAGALSAAVSEAEAADEWPVRPCLRAGLLLAASGRDGGRTVGQHHPQRLHAGSRGARHSRRRPGQPAHAGKGAGRGACGRGLSDRVDADERLSGAVAAAEDAALAALLRELTGEVPLAAVSYGTEAGLYQAAGLDAIICGPGDIGRAHKPDEYILTSELAACQRLIEALGARCAA